MATKTYTYSDIQKHRSSVSCWVVLYGNVYDVTSFLQSHPGGSKAILELAGTDATEAYDPIHPPGTLTENLSPECKLGVLDKSTLPKLNSSADQSQPEHHHADDDDDDDDGLDTPSSCLNLDDIEKLATKRISPKAWGYYFSAADDLHSKSLNSKVYRSILLRPRILVDCTRCSLSTRLLQNSLPVSLPIFISPAAMARLAHPSGEAGIASACANFGAMQIISNSASQTPEEIVAAAEPGQVFGWQLYVQKDRSRSEAMLKRIAKLPTIKFVCVTLDAPVPAKREDDERKKKTKRRGALPEPAVGGAAPRVETDAEGFGGDGVGGVGRGLFVGTAADLTWRETLGWLEGVTDLPIVLKGVQTHEDAYVAANFAPRVRGIILSNHGGRSLDTAPPAVHTLLEIRKYCPGVFDRVDVWVDGGIRRGTDVVKALALGAKAVGLGRAPLYGLGAGGQKGVERVLEILRGEIDTAMRLLGVEKVEELGMQHINARAVERDLYDGESGISEIDRWLRSKL